MVVTRRAALAAMATTMVASCSREAPPAKPPAQPRAQPSQAAVRTGADVWAARGWQPLAGHRVGVLTNPTGVLADMTNIVDSMTAAGVRPVAAFGPEHGFRGTAQAGSTEGSSTDERTGIPVFDTYRTNAEDLAGIYRQSGVDTVVYDIQGAGARFYTYTWAMYRAMQAAVLSGARFVVLDRPCPAGATLAGPVLQQGFTSDVGLKPIAQQPGMTAGELARMFDARFLPADTGGRHLTDLQVVAVEGLHADALYSDTGLVWVPPSPNLPTVTSALLYPGTCMFEGTTFSVGRGTCTPFEILGAPGVDAHWAQRLNPLNLPGVRMREAFFTPTFDRFTATTCGGVQVHVTDPHAIDALRTAVALIVTAKQLYPTIFGWTPDNYIDRLTGSRRFRTMVDSGATTDDIIASWQPELDTFRADREPFRLYR